MTRTLILDIETIGEDWENLDKISQDSLSAWIKNESKNEEEFENNMKNLKEGLGFSPLTGEIVTIGVHDFERAKSAVYYQTGDKEETKSEIEGVLYEPMDEARMLNKFWEIAQSYDVFVTFNGYQFDMPYILIRSAVHGVKPTANLMSNRYVSMQRGGKIHVDLQDQLSFYGAMRRRGSLHMWARVFGIQTPKSEEVNGHAVADLYKEGRYLDIAKYNAADIKATSELYSRWLQFLKF